MKLPRETVGDTPEGAGWYVAVPRPDGSGPAISVAFFGKRAEAEAEVYRRNLRNLPRAIVETAARTDGWGHPLAGA